MTRLLIIHHDPTGVLDAQAARLAAGLSQKAGVTLLLPGGALVEPAASLLGSRVGLQVGRGGKRALIGALPALARQLKSDPPDHLLATGNGAGWLAAAARIVAGRPGRLTVKLDRPLGRQHALARRYQTTVFAEAQRVLVPSDGDRRALVAAFPALAQRFLAVAEPILPATGRALPPPRRKGDLRRMVTAVASADGGAVDALLAAMSVLATRAELTILCPYEAVKMAVDRTIGRSGVSDRAQSAVGRDLTPHLRDADVYVLAGAEEALPPRLIEALGHDRAVVATDSFASAHDLLDGAPGCAVVRPDDPAALATAIDTALAHRPRPSLRPIAERHGVAAAVQAHGWAMGVL